MDTVGNVSHAVSIAGTCIFIQITKITIIVKIITECGSFSSDEDDIHVEFKNVYYALCCINPKENLEVSV